MIPLTVAILAGGQSRRMGQDKAEILWQGETLLARTARVAQEAGYPVLVVGRTQPPDWPLSRAAFHPDSIADSGPLAGLVTALEATEGAVLALACDMPLLTEHALRWLSLQDYGMHGVAVQQETHWQPLFSIYTHSALALAQDRLRQSKRSLQGLLTDGDFTVVTPPPEIADVIVNVNTPSDIQRLMERLETG